MACVLLCIGLGRRYFHPALTPESTVTSPKTPANVSPALTVTEVPNVSPRQRATRIYFSGAEGIGSHLLKPLLPAILAALGLPEGTRVKYRTDKSKTRGVESFCEMLADMAAPKTFQVEGASACVQASWGKAGGLASFKASVAK